MAATFDTHADPFRLHDTNGSGPLLARRIAVEAMGGISSNPFQIEHLGAWGGETFFCAQEEDEHGRAGRRYVIGVTVERNRARVVEAGPAE